MIKVSTYKELEYYYELFSKENPSLVIIKSEGGLGKSTLAKEKIKDALFINGHTTPLALYQKLCAYDGGELKLVLDDIDSLMQSYVMRALIKQICETQPVKKIGYLSTANIAQALPQSISVKLSTLILCNNLNTLNKNVSAIETRGHTVNFVPSNEEITVKMREIVGKYNFPEEVIDFVAEHGKFATAYNIRTLIKALDHFKMGDGWKEKVLQEMGISSKLIEIEKLQRDFDTNKERIENFSGSRATYFRWKSQSISV